MQTLFRQHKHCREVDNLFMFPSFYCPSVPTNTSNQK